MSLDHRFLGLWLSKNLSVKDQRQIFQAFQTMWSLLKLLRSAAKAATDHMKMTQHGSVSIKLYRQKQAMGWIWPEGRTLPNPDLVQFLCFLFSFPLKMVTMRSRDATDFDLQPSWAGNLGLLTLRSMLLGLFWADLPRRSHCCPVPHTPSSNSQTGMSSRSGHETTDRSPCAYCPSCFFSLWLRGCGMSFPPSALWRCIPTFCNHSKLRSNMLKEQIVFVISFEDVIQLAPNTPINAIHYPFLLEITCPLR